MEESNQNVKVVIPEKNHSLKNGLLTKKLLKVFLGEKP